MFLAAFMKLIRNRKALPPCAGLMLMLAASPALSQSATPAGSGAPPAPASAAPGPTQEKSLWERDKLLGDLGGVRAALENKGISLNVLDTDEVLGNPTGGIRQGAIYEGATLMTLAVDPQKLFGAPAGGGFWVSAYQIRGSGLTATDLGNLNIVSTIEAPASTRLFELRYEQSFLDGKASVRFGQLAADQEFIISQYGGLFVNSGFGWPTLPAYNLPEGGPAYPLATPGIRLKGQPMDALTLLAAVFNGNPNDNGSGTTFALNKGVFAIVEAQIAVNSGDHPVGLPGTYKVGAWYNSNEFADQSIGADGLSLANPASNGVALYHRGDWSLYAVADQLIYRVPGTKDQGLGVFARIMSAPDDRNLIDFNLYGGATYKGIIPGRADDTAGVGVIYTRLSNAASAYDTAVGYYSGTAYPVRTAETVLEATYQIQMTPWWVLQPDFQYVFNPGGNIPDPLNPTQTIGDAAVFGLRTTIAF